MDASGSGIVFIQRFSRETNGKLERFYDVYDQKQHRFKSMDEYVHWHNENKPHLSLKVETPETPIQAFHGKLPLQKTETTQQFRMRNDNGKLQQVIRFSILR